MYRAHIDINVLLAAQAIKLLRVHTTQDMLVQPHSWYAQDDVKVIVSSDQ